MINRQMPPLADKMHVYPAFGLRGVTLAAKYTKADGIHLNLGRHPRTTGGIAKIATEAQIVIIRTLARVRRCLAATLPSGTQRQPGTMIPEQTLAFGLGIEVRT